MQTQNESEDIKARELITLQIEFQTTEINAGNRMEVWKKCAQQFWIVVCENEGLLRDQ
jgi:hypothetical protein